MDSFIIRTSDSTPPPRREERLLSHLIPISLLALLTLVFAHSFVCVWNLGAAPIEGSDPGVFMWVISWVNHA
ncbi:MAG: hypothetical protein P8Y94_17240, partial [Acidobacteriota bacterium]